MKSEQFLHQPRLCHDVVKKQTNTSSHTFLRLCYNFFVNKSSAIAELAAQCGTRWFFTFEWQYLF